ncbi:hypothetical protein OUZ56_001703 [Daphnia magna]|uniref:Uncharacterized protein n=1 Tax=Daphnia magna TaxID=35525 RepID=A0ABR0A3G7_9CRUS|nr:hypothetical protein OUZ56_001703 [Daphnia magna]
MHDLDSELNENHGNQFFIYMLKTINEVGALTELFSLIFLTASLKRKPMTKSKSAFNFDYAV